MALKLKSKIAFGGIFLFLLLALVAGISIFYFNKQISGSREILKDNYESIEYGKNMLQALNDWDRNPTQSSQLFEKNLKSQEDNITEPGEGEMTSRVRKSFEALILKPGLSSTVSAIRSEINKIIEINLHAISKKNELYQQAAENAKVVITLIITFCLLLGFTFITNFPGLIAGPIVKLTEGFRAIANKNYSERIHLNRKDEFGEMAEAFNNMAERLDEYEHSNISKIMFEKRRAETVINSLKDASIGIDNNGVILFANQQALQLLSLREADIVGQKQEEVMKRNDLFRFLLNSDNSMPFKVVVNDKENYFTKEIIDIRQEQEKLGNVIILEDITPFKEKDVAKTNFIATISHELKTPLASSDFSLKLLEDERIGKLSTEHRELVQNLKLDNQRMLRILSELLDLSQVESGKIMLNVEPVQPKEIIEKAIQTVTAAAKEKSIHIHIELNEEVVPIMADADKITWVLNNFLSNAIRYSPAGTDIVIAARPAGAKMIEISVTDKGPGIDPSLHQKVFDRFFKVPGNEEIKSSGLGLAISKEFIENMSGEIGVESSLNQGSRFYFRIPVA
ncbi:MAG: HAMP domain-containing protein [Chitinophagaceae bacterium]|nr:HAMP domain-containing protein [Chitinophagaceae bacterium]